MILSELHLWCISSSNYTRRSFDKALGVVSDKPPVSELLYAIIKSISKFNQVFLFSRIWCNERTGGATNTKSNCKIWITMNLNKETKPEKEVTNDIGNASNFYQVKTCTNLKIF